jgi:IS1 family transposase
MNRLPIEKRAQILTLMTEGNSLRAISRIVGCSINTVTKLLTDLGEACAAYQDEHLRELSCQTIQCDEIWAFCYSKAKNVPSEHVGEFGYGDVWTWTAIDADTKLVPSWLVADRSADAALAFMTDLEKRISGPIQLTTDGHHAYLRAVERAFKRTWVDYAMLQKIYGTSPEDQRRYSPGVCIGVKSDNILGNPDPDKISTSYVERQNLTMRMSMRRFTRLTNAFSKKVENHAAAVAIHFMHYNFGRPHKTLANPYPRTPTIKRSPAMAAGVTDHIWTPEEIVRLLDQPQAPTIAPEPSRKPNRARERHEHRPASPRPN